MTLTYDVVVVGAGPAGSVAAYHLAKMGFRVAVLEMRSWDRVWGKPCGDAIGHHHFPNARLPEPPQAVIKNVVDGVLIYSPSMSVVYKVEGRGYIVDRRALGQWILKEAERSGAELYLETSARNPIVEGGRVVGVAAVRQGKVIAFRAKVVVDATGSSAALRRKLPFEHPIRENIDPKDTNIAFREIAVLQEDVENPNFIRIYINQELAPGGYWWLFPEKPNVANIGVGVQGGVGNPPPQEKLREIKSRGLVPKYLEVVESGGAIVPTRRPIATLVGPGIVAIGDAASTVNPLHGGGMGYAFYSAYLASKAIEQGFERGCFDEQCLWSLNVEYMRSLGAKQASLDLFRMFLQRLSNDDIEFGMKKRLVPEVDVYEVSSKGELKPSVVEKALIVLRGLTRPSLLFKLKLVADYMKKMRELYMKYPEKPEELPKWVSQVNRVIGEFLAKLGG